MPPQPSVPRHGPSRGWILALALVAGGLPACASKPKPVDMATVSRSSPRQAYEYLKTMIAANQTANEWATFSPGFKRRISEQAGRNVDVGDYSLARSTIASNSNKNIQLILESRFVAEKLLSEDVAVVTIQSGKKKANPRFIRMTSWELTIRGEGEPVSEFIPSAADVMGIGEDGSVSMRIPTGSSTGSFLKSIPPEKIKRLVVDEAWYLDDFGGVEDVVLEGLKGRGEPTPPPTRGGEGARPPEPTEAPGSPDGFGSPDGAPGSPDGFGSPDGAPSK